MIRIRLKSVTLNIPRIMRAAEKKTHRGLSRVGLAVEARAKQNLSAMGAGPARAKKAPAKGPPPADQLRWAAQQPRDVAARGPGVVTGSLRASVTHEVVNVGGNTVVRVGTDLMYGFWQEYGTRRRAARPWLRPALAALMAQRRSWFR